MGKGDGEKVGRVEFESVRKWEDEKMRRLIYSLLLQLVEVRLN